MPPRCLQALIATRRPLVWLVVLALAIYGQSATVVQLLGPAHRHELALQMPQIASTNVLQRIDVMFRDIRAWRAELRERLLPGQGANMLAHERAHVHADGTVHTHDGTGHGLVDDASAGHAHSHDTPAQSHAHEAAGHAHSHDGYQRHHHDPHDNSVVALDAMSGAVADASSQAAAGSATLPMAFAPQQALLPGLECPNAWCAESLDHWTDASLRPSERPPRS